MHYKKIFSVILLIILLFVCGCNQNKEEDDPNNTNINFISGDLLVGEKPLVKWEGRYNYVKGENNTADKVYLYYTATGFTVDFYGSSLDVEFYHTKSNIYYNIALDDEILPNPKQERRFYLPSGEENTTVRLIDNLEIGHHTIKCVKMDEGYDGLTAVVSLETDGYFYYRDKEYDDSNYKFMFVCASGGTGFGSLGFSNDSSKMSRNTANSSSLHAFNYLTGRRFGADMQFVSCSGWGVYYPRSISKVLDYCGITPENSVNSSKQTGNWDYYKFVPDVIIFNIGGNDTTQNNFDKTVYQEEVVNMVNKLHEIYPKAKMIWTHTNSNAGKYAVTAMSDAGIIKEDYMKVVIIPKVGAGDTGENTYGASDHNSFKTHMDASKLLVAAVEEWGFESFIDDVVFSDYDWILDKR